MLMDQSIPLFNTYTVLFFLSDLEILYIKRNFVIKYMNFKLFVMLGHT